MSRLFSIYNGLQLVHFHRVRVIHLKGHVEGIVVSSSQDCVTTQAGHTGQRNTAKVLGDLGFGTGVDP